MGRGLAGTAARPPCLGPHVVGSRVDPHAHKQGHLGSPRAVSSEMRLVALAIGQGHRFVRRLVPLGRKLVARHFRKRPLSSTLGLKGWQLILCLEQLGASFSETFKVGQLLASPNSGGYETAFTSVFRDYSGINGITQTLHRAWNGTE